MMKDKAVYHSVYKIVNITSGPTAACICRPVCLCVCACVCENDKQTNSPPSTQKQSPVPLKGIQASEPTLITSSAGVDVANASPASLDAVVFPLTHLTGFRSWDHRGPLTARTRTIPVLRYSLVVERK